MKKISSNILIHKEESKDNSLFSFKTLSEKFFWSLKWNTIESSIYHLIFIVHQWYMFSLVDPTLYGIMGTFFACSYLGVTILMGALDVALMPWIVPYTENKKNFKCFIQEHIIPQIGLYLLTPAIVWIFFNQSWIPEQFYILKNHFFIMGIFIACEGIKKLLRHILQLMFLNNYTAFLEILGIFLYCTIVWSQYLMGYTFSIERLIIPFIISSLISISGMISAMLFFYYKLPLHTNTAHQLPTWKQLRYIRWIASINQITRSLFSTNIVIPISSVFFGFIKTGTMSFINYVSHTFTFFIYKICAPSTGAFFGRITTSTKTDQMKAFHLVMKTISIVIGATCCIAVCALVYGRTQLTLSVTTILLLFLALHTIENIFIMYEKFLIIRNQLELLAVLNIVSLFISYLFISSSLPLFLAAISCFLVRFIVFGITSYAIIMLKK